MNATDQVAALEKAILDRANTLAEEHLTQAQRARDRIHADSADRLRLLEERETLVAQARADREYRRRVQASEIRMQAELDRLRWGLVDAVFERLNERLAALVKDEERYLPILGRLLAGAASAIEAEELEVLVSDADHRRFKERWPEIAESAAPGRRLLLSDEQCACRGGVLVRTTDRRISVNNTFEGRLERLREDLNRTVLERLFPSLGQRGVAFNG